MQRNQGTAYKPTRSLRLPLVVCLALVGVAVLTSLAIRSRAVQGVEKVKLSVEDPRPLAKAVEMLEAQYGWVITYEDPTYADAADVADVTTKVRKDLNKFAPGKAPRVLIPKGGVLSVEYDVPLATKRPADPAAVVQQLLNAHQAGGHAGVFRLEKRGSILHVIPIVSRNRAGEFISQTSPLDALITLPPDAKNGVQTLEAICAAVTQATGTRVLVATIPTNLFMRYTDRQGASNQPARDVLVNLLENVKSDMKLSWELLYDPGMETYYLNILVVREPHS